MLHRLSMQIADRRFYCWSMLEIFYEFSVRVGIRVLFSIALLEYMLFLAYRIGCARANQEHFPEHFLS